MKLQREDTVTYDAVLRGERLTKRFGSITAIENLNIELRRSEVLGVVGDNGAGKSTLAKILCGFHSPDEGRLILEGEPIHLSGVADARKRGIETVYQDLALIPQLPVYYNLFLNREIVRGGRLGVLARRRMRQIARNSLEELNVEIRDIDAPVADLSGGQRQAVAVARAVMSDAKILILDEPLSAMGPKEAHRIMTLIKTLAAGGKISIIVVDHNYAHVFELCERVNVVRNRIVEVDIRTKDTTAADLTALMIAGLREQQTASAG